jgi:hypothetical protein
MSSTYNIARIECDLSLPYQALVNAVDGGQIFMARSRDHRFELGIRDKGIWQETIAQFTSVTLEIKSTTGRTAAALVSVTIAAPFSTVAEGEWVNRTSQHVAVDLNETQTGLSMGGSDSKDFWLVITATNTSGRKVTLAAGTITMIEDGGQYSGNTPTPYDPAYLNADQVMALVQALRQNWTITENGYQRRLGVDSNGQPTDDIRPA